MVEPQRVVPKWWQEGVSYVYELDRSQTQGL